MERSYAHRSLVTEEQVRWQPLCACTQSCLSHSLPACRRGRRPSHTAAATPRCLQSSHSLSPRWLGLAYRHSCSARLLYCLTHSPDQFPHFTQIGTLAAYLAGEDPRSLTAARCREVAGQLQMPYQAVRGPCCVELAGALDASGCTPPSADAV